MNDKAFETLVADMHTSVYRFALRRVSAADAADVAAETFAIAWAKRDSIPPDAELPWLLRVAANVILNVRRGDTRRARLFARLSALEDTSVPSDEAASDDAHVVRAALARLRSNDQELLRLVVWDDLDEASAAAILGCTRQALRVRLHRARRRLASQLATAEAAGLTPAPVKAN